MANLRPVDRRESYEQQGFGVASKLAHEREVIQEEGLQTDLLHQYNHTGACRRVLPPSQGLLRNRWFSLQNRRGPKRSPPQKSQAEPFVRT